MEVLVQPRRLGLINGLLILLTWSIVGLTLSTNWISVFPVILSILIPLAILVSWRSSVLAQCLINGNGTVKLYVYDGFKWGVISGVIFWTLSISTDVLAAGSALLGASFIQVLEYILKISVPFTLLFGVVGAIHSIVFYYFNRWLIVNYS